MVYIEELGVTGRFHPTSRFTTRKLYSTGSSFGRREASEESLFVAPRQGAARAAQPLRDQDPRPYTPLVGAPQAEQNVSVPGEATRTPHPTAMFGAKPGTHCAPRVGAPGLACTQNPADVGERSGAPSSTNLPPRRSTRATTARLVYDASTGKHVLPCAK